MMSEDLRYRDLVAVRAAASMNGALIGGILFGPVGAIIGGAVGSYGGPRKK